MEDYGLGFRVFRRALGARIRVEVLQKSIRDCGRLGLRVLGL